MLESITIKNFKCLRGIHEIEFQEGIYSIKGKKEGDSSSSNRAGKTSFLEAIRFGMFKGQTSDVVTEGESEMFVELAISGSKLYAGNSETRVNDEPVLVSQLKAVSEVLLGMDQKLFNCTVGAFADSIYGFLSLKPKEQKDFLLHYFCDSSVDWDSAREYIQEKVCGVMENVKQVEQEYDRVRNLLDEIDKDFYTTKLEDMKYELKTKEQEYALTKESSENLFQEYKAMLSRSSHLSDSITRLEGIKETIKEKEKQLQGAIEQKKHYHESLADYLTLPGYDYRIKAFENKITVSKHDVKRLTESVNTYETSGGLCPILQQECPHHDCLEKFYHDSKEEIKEKELGISTLTQSCLEAKEERKMVSNIASKISVTTNLIASLDEDLKALKEQDASIKDLIEEFQDLQEQIKFVESGLNADRVEALLNSISTLKTNIDKVSAILLDYDIKSVELTDKDSLLVDLNKQLLEYSTAAKLVSPKGLPHVMLQEVLTLFESYINSYLSFVDMEVVVSGYSELKSLEDYCQNDGTNYRKNEAVCSTCGGTRGNKLDESITILTKDSGVEWAHESSGGKGLIALAVRLALLKMAKKKKAEADFLILDEVFSNLDSRNKSKVLELLNFAMTDLDLKQIFLVSHDELKDSTDYEITIEHLNGQVNIV